MPDDLPRHPAQDGRLIDANLHLLDRQLLDRDGRPVLAVGDVEMDRTDSGRLVITCLVLGSGLTARFFGADRPVSTRETMAWDAVTEIDAAISTDADRDDIPGLWIERWWRDHVIGRIPGGRHDPG